MLNCSAEHGRREKKVENEEGDNEPELEIIPWTA